MRSILDRAFRYTPSFATDVSRTFERIRREQRRSVSRPGERTSSSRRPAAGERRRFTG